MPIRRNSPAAPTSTATSRSRSLTSSSRTSLTRMTLRPSRSTIWRSNRSALSRISLWRRLNRPTSMVRTRSRAPVASNVSTSRHGMKIRRRSVSMTRPVTGGYLPPIATIRSAMVPIGSPAGSRTGRPRHCERKSIWPPGGGSRRPGDSTRRMPARRQRTGRTCWVPAARPARLGPFSTGGGFLVRRLDAPVPHAGPGRGHSTATARPARGLHPATPDRYGWNATDRDGTGPGPWWPGSRWSCVRRLGDASGPDEEHRSRPLVGGRGTRRRGTRRRPAPAGAGSPAPVLLVRHEPVRGVPVRSGLGGVAEEVAEPRGVQVHLLAVVQRDLHGLLDVQLLELGHRVLDLDEVDAVPHAVELLVDRGIRDARVVHALRVELAAVVAEVVPEGIDGRREGVQRDVEVAVREDARGVDLG